jgi:hypothetical protein
LSNEGDERRVLGGMVKGVAQSDPFKNELCCLGYTLGVSRLAAVEGAQVNITKPFAERIGQNFRRVEHHIPYEAKYSGRSRGRSAL